MTTFNQVAVNAIRLAALTQLGPLAGGLFLSGSALAANFFASSDLAKAGAAVLTELTGGTAAGFFQSALQGFSPEHNHDLEKSLHQAAKQALQQLRTENQRLRRLVRQLAQLPHPHPIPSALHHHA